MIKNIKNEILIKPSFSKMYSIIENTILTCIWGGSLVRANFSLKTILIGLFLSLFTLQCSKGGTDPVATPTPPPDGTITCKAGETKNANGECVSPNDKTPDDTMKCPIDQNMQADGTYSVTWTSLGSTSNMNIARYAMKTAVVCTKIYAFGGSNGSNLYSIEVFDTTTNVWSLLGVSSNLNNRNSMGIATIGTKIYAFGGANSSNDALNSTEVFDTTTNVWSLLGANSNLNIARYNMGVATIGTKIYAISGKGFDYNLLKSTEVFDTTTNVWTTLGASSNINTARFGMGVTTIGNKIYVFGGQDNNTNNLNTTEVLDTTTNIWTSLSATSNLNTGRSGIGAAKIGNKFYAFGGQDPGPGFNLLKTTEVFDTTTNVWSLLGATSNLNTVRYEMGAETVGSNIYVFGGHIENNYFNTMEVYKPFP